MQVDVRIHDIDLTEGLRMYVVRRLRFALGRFGTQIGTVVVRVSDVNGQRGGIDQCCRITATLAPSGSAVVEALDADLYGAIDRAAERLGRACGRALERERHQRTGRASVKTEPSVAQRKRDTRKRLAVEIREPVAF